MLDYNTIEYKGHIRTDQYGNNVHYIDLLSTSVNTDFTHSSGATVVVVNEYYVARPDLISLALYGTDKYADVLCKYNGISNPFELNEDMSLICPTLGDLQRYFSPNGGPSELVQDNSTIVAKKSTAKLKTELRNPGQATVNDVNYVIDKTNNYVFY